MFLKHLWNKNFAYISCISLRTRSCWRSLAGNSVICILLLDLERFLLTSRTPLANHCCNAKSSQLMISLLLETETTVISEFIESIDRILKWSQVTTVVFREASYVWYPHKRLDNSTLQSRSSKRFISLFSKLQICVWTAIPFLILCNLRQEERLN